MLKLIFEASEFERTTQSCNGTTTSPRGPLTSTERACRREGRSGRDGFGCGGNGSTSIVVDAGRSSGALPT